MGADVITEQEIRILAALASLDVRTVRRALVEGLPPRSQATRAAIVAVLNQRGHKAAAKRLAGAA